MVDVNNLHLVKDETMILKDLIEQYREAFSAYYEELTQEKDKDHEHAHYKDKVEDMMAYLHPLHAWISQAEARLIDQLAKDLNDRLRQVQGCLQETERESV